MKEQLLVTMIGEDLSVKVYFEYQPEEPETLEEPGCPSEVTINNVFVDSELEQDIEDCLNERTLDKLKEECQQMLIDESEDDR